MSNGDITQELVARMRRQREVRIPVGKFTFIARRPTDVEALELHAKESTLAEMARRFVTGWENVVEDDVAGGGGTTVVAFAPQIWDEWCADRPDLWGPIANRVLEVYELHAKEVQAAAGN